MSSPRVGFVSICRPSFDMPLAAQLTEQLWNNLTGAGFQLVGRLDLITNSDQIPTVIQELQAMPLDLLLVFQASFADSTIVIALAQQLNIPLLLWAVPEVPTGDRLHLNALCGINLAAHALTRAGYRYSTIYDSVDSPSAFHQLQGTVQAGQVYSRLRRAIIGRIGEPPLGFVSCEADPLFLKQQLGVTIVPFDLNILFERARNIGVHRIDSVYGDWKEQLDGINLLDQTALRGTMASYLALHDLVQQEHLDGIALRCWFQFIQELGCASCGAQSMLTNELIPCACEADVHGVVTQLILQWFSGGPVFDSDVVSFNFDANTAVFWHCGKAPIAMADPAAKPRASNHFNFRKPLVMEFSFKPGRVTLARLSMATGSFQLVVGSGEIVQSPPSFAGTSGVVRFDHSAADVLKTILSKGLEHHLALTYGDHVEALLELARMLNLPVLQL